LKECRAYSDLWRKYCEPLIKLLRVSSQVKITKTAADGTTTTTDYHGVGAMRVAVNNPVNDMMERYIADRDGITVAEVRACAAAIVAEQEEEERRRTALPVEIDVSAAQ
jgi:hypothetical protein